MYAAATSAYLLGFSWLALSFGGAAPPSVEPPAIQEEKNLGGIYAAAGNENGKNYHGSCLIVRKGDVYLVTWNFSTGDSFTGIGVRTGDNFAVAWATDKIKGVNVYRILPGSAGLSGRWATMPGNGRVWTERLTFLKELPEEE